MHVSFLLNGERISVEAAPTTTLLDWLREERGLTGTKEGCNEGDCGACTVMVTDAEGARALNACILFMGQIDGRAIRTVEGIAGPDGTLHPVQQAMIDHHGSQCGFCTPGFVVAMAAAHLSGARDHDNQIAGNLCRCTGYAPIIRAAEAAAEAPVPDWMRDTPPKPSAGPAPAAAGRDPNPAEIGADWGQTDPLAGTGASAAGDPGRTGEAVRPATVDALARWYLDHPDATLVGGATDVGLWVTKGLRDLGTVAFLNGIEEMRRIEVGADRIRIGAGVTLSALGAFMSDRHPTFAELIRRYGSVQVRNAATIGGNIANGSPIGDGPPALIALDATLHLRKGDAERSLPLEDYFIDYGRQDRQPGEFVEAISIPVQPDRLRCAKISKRFDQDISALCACAAIEMQEGVIVSARVAFGGMAGIPKRARSVEGALVGRSPAEALAPARDALSEDFTPLSDMRASAAYRMAAARGVLARFLGQDTAHVLDVVA
ncbi:xanthine dehydrogenase small subunit [Palleronia aestuarii]|uniref:Xanthine dehydrogenase small subunit n=1 Tax=Palleronia aestuarii TaxID=568105 RepID=A0A2W7N7T4_9RHOB|nr:xanthine dehydrogenase small subunit [Palleronia aestuarii]PZX16191.1 xanthine dehydrogenase small subunit [Palleronia aestuarii]